MSHTDLVDVLPNNFEIIGSTDNCAIAAIQNVEKNFIILIP